MPNSKIYLLSGLFKVINWYTKRFSFPYRGWKYFLRFLSKFGLDQKTFVKKIGHNLYLNAQPIDHIQKSIFWYGYYELEASKTWQSFIKSNSIIVDIGANIGYYTIISACKAVNGKVFAFEPVPFTYKLLQSNIQLNQLNNVETFQIALLDKSKRTQVYISDKNNIGMSGLTVPENFSGNVIDILTTNLDEFIKELSITEIDLIKIDVEGAEFKILQGMLYILQTQSPVILIEIINELLNRFGNQSSDIYKLLSSYGYSAFEIKNINTLSWINDSKEGDNILFIKDLSLIPSNINIITMR